MVHAETVHVCMLTTDAAAGAHVNASPCLNNHTSAAEIEQSATHRCFSSSHSKLQQQQTTKGSVRKALQANFQIERLGW